MHPIYAPNCSEWEETIWFVKVAFANGHAWVEKGIDIACSTFTWNCFTVHHEQKCSVPVDKPWYCHDIFFGVEIFILCWFSLFCCCLVEEKFRHQSYSTLITFKAKGNSIWFIILIFKSLFAALTATMPGGGEGSRALHKSKICPQVLPHRFNFTVNKIWNHYSFFSLLYRKVRTSAKIADIAKEL